jgi:hypothetical protein
LSINRDCACVVAIYSLELNRVATSRAGWP